MKTHVHITADPSTGQILANGEPVDHLVAYAGAELALDVHVHDNVILGDNLQFWVTLDPHDTDVKRVSDATDSILVPDLATLRGEPIPSEAGHRPRDGGKLIMDMAGAVLEDIKTIQISKYRGETNGVLSHAMISAGGRTYRAPEDFRVEFNDNETGHGVIRIDPELVQPEGTIYRIKHRLPEWVQNNGRHSGEIICKPELDTKFKTAWLTTNDYRTTPIKIVVKTGPAFSIGPLVKSRLPASFAEEEGIVKLLEDFFEYGCQNGGPFNALHTASDFRDPDKAADRFLDLLLWERAPFLPDGAAADRKIVLKHAVRFFENRGNPKSWAFLSRAIFGQEAKIEFPADYLFRGSDSDWRQHICVKGISVRNGLLLRPDLETQIRKTLGMTDEPVSQFPDSSLLPHLLGTKIRGLNSRAEGIVENVIQTTYGGVTVNEFHLSSVIGEFQSDELVHPVDGIDVLVAPSGRQTLTHFHFMVVNQITEIQSPEYGVFAPGLPIAFEPSRGSAILLSGSPFKYEILDSGFVSGRSMVAVVRSIDGAVQRLSVKTSPQVELKGEWIGGSSFASDNQYRTQDGWFYQIFSYVVESSVPENEHRPHNKEHLHPAGFQMFSKFVEPVTVVSASAGAVNRYAILGGRRRSLHVGDVGSNHIDVYVGGRLLYPHEWTLHGSGFRTFVLIDPSVEIKGQTPAVVSVKIVDRDAKLYPLNSIEETLVTNSVGNSETFTQAGTTNLTSYVDALRADYILAQLTDYPPEWIYRVIQFPNSGDISRTAKVGNYLLQASSGRKQPIVAVASNETDTYVVIAYKDSAEVAAYPIQNPFKRIVP